MTEGLDVFSSSFANNIFRQKYSMDRQEFWKDTCRRVVNAVCGQYLPNSLKEEIYKAMVERKFIPAGRYLYAAGREFHQICNCFCFMADDSREGWADLMHKITASLMAGGGIGSNYSLLRPEGALIKKTGGFSTGPIALMHMVDQSGKYIMQGGARRSAIWAGLSWDHNDIFKFMHLKDWSSDLLAMKEKDADFHLPMEGTNISNIYNTDFFVAAENDDHPKHELSMKVWMENCRQAFSSGEPGMSFNFCKDQESLRNACTEFTSESDSDSCNLGTVWMNRCKSKEEFAHICHIGTVFLICGGIYSHMPFDKAATVRKANNRIGLGVGGIHEWLMSKGYGYEVTPEMHKWLNLYEQESDSAAYIWSKELSVTMPKSKRAIAPNGTLGILAETTTAIEPMFCAAYKRRYLVGNEWKYEYVIDGTVQRLLDKGIRLEQIKDAYDIGFKERVKFQADVQNYVDMAISSTCNMPAWGTESNNEKTLERYSKILLKYAKRLRGFTVYPDGARKGQPLTRVSLVDALENGNKVFEERVHECRNGVCGL